MTHPTDLTHLRRPAYPLARRADPGRLDLDSFARAASMHPDLVRRLVALGLLESTVDSRGRPTFAAAELVSVARMQRLRAGLSLNYAALGLVLDLLDRIAELEARARRRSDRPITGG